MKHFDLRWLIMAVALALSAPTHAKLKALSCEPEWAALLTEIGGTNIDVSSATTGLQDPHRIEARPSLIARARNAQLLVCTGLELESGWLPLLMQQSGNPRIQPGQPGNFMAGSLVRRLEISRQIDRSQGDVHGSGNPHIQMNPHNIARVAEALAERLVELDPAHRAEYAAGYRQFQQRWNEAIAGWEQRATPLRGVTVVTHHKDMVYLLDWLGMQEIGNLEPKPGLEPSSAHLARLLEQLRQQPARMVLRTPYQSEQASAWLAENAHIKAVMLPNTVGGSDAASSLFTLFDDILTRLLDANT